MFSTKKSLPSWQALRKISTCGICWKNHYEVLGVSSKATQAEIKSAYYKQSMIYHPDKNPDSEEAKMIFRQLTEAYDILGNVMSRKLYDKGMIVGSDGTTLRDDDDDDTQTRFYKAREKSRTVPVPTGKTHIYDFDTWTKAHYSDTRQKTYARKEGFESKQKSSVDNKHMDGTQFVLISVTLSLLVYFSAAFTTTDYDNVLDNRIEQSRLKDDNQRK